MKFPVRQQVCGANQRIVFDQVRCEFETFLENFIIATNASEREEKRNSRRSSISSKSSKSSKESVFERTWFGEIKRAFLPWDPEEFEGRSNSKSCHLENVNKDYSPMSLRQQCTDTVFYFVMDTYAFIHK